MNQSRILDELRSRFNHNSLIDSCSGEGCKVDMVDIPTERLIVDLEHEFDIRQKTEKRCDRVLFFITAMEKTLSAVPIELKSGTVRESDVIEKLKNSLNFVTQIVSNTIRSKIVYNPILFEGRGIKWTNPKGTKQLKVSFRGSSIQILVGRCGRPRNLARILYGK